MKHNRGVLSEKEQLSQQVRQIAKTCTTLDELSKSLHAYKITPYYRNNKLTGVWLGNRKYRLTTTLGIGKEHLKQLTREQERLHSLQQSQKQRDQSQRLEL